MTQERWTAVDGYITDLLAPDDPVLSATLRASAAAGLPAINVSPAQGKLLMVLATAQGARRILEIGTLGGYSTIWLARGLAAGGRLITLEADAQHAEVANANIARAGLDGTVEIILGPALQTLPRLAAPSREPFDLIFIDADKESYPEYLEWSVKLARRGTLIIADNIVRKGEVIDADSSDPRVHGTRRFMERLAADPRLTAAAIQTVGAKGYDGFAVAVVTMQPGMMPFTFATDAETRKFCEEIVRYMVDVLKIPESEAVGRVNRRWQGRNLAALRNELAHDSADFWAKDIYFGHDSMWWKSPAGLRPLPYP